MCKAFISTVLRFQVNAPLRKKMPKKTHKLSPNCFPWKGLMVQFLLYLQQHFILTMNWLLQVFVLFVYCFVYYSVFQPIINTQNNVRIQWGKYQERTNNPIALAIIFIVIHTLRITYLVLRKELCGMSIINNKDIFIVFFHVEEFLLISREFIGSIIKCGLIFKRAVQFHGL